MNYFKQLRTDKGLSVLNVAKDTGISFVTIYNIEKDKHIPNGKTLKILCDYFKVNIDEIIEKYY